MYRKTGVLLWDECASKMFGVIQIYSDETLPCSISPWACLPFLMLMVLPLKLLNWLMLGGCFGLFP